MAYDDKIIPFKKGPLSTYNISTGVSSLDPTKGELLDLAKERNKLKLSDLKTSEQITIEERAAAEAKLIAEGKDVIRRDQHGNKLKYFDRIKNQGAGWYILGNDGNYHNPSHLSGVQRDALGIIHENTTVPKNRGHLENVGDNVYKYRHPGISNLGMTYEDAMKTNPEGVYINKLMDHIEKPDTIWKKASRAAGWALKTPLGRLGSRILGGLPMIVGLEMDFSKPFSENSWMPEYEYTPVTGKSTIWE
tara:strand:+ start:100 stop:843 length:744 start_codon:yes stop_codon:yes gene_type:complete